MGSRFMATRESESHENVKQAMVSAKDVCTVSVPKTFMLARDLQNTFTEKFQELQKSGASDQTAQPVSGRTQPLPGPAPGRSRGRRNSLWPSCGLD